MSDEDFPKKVIHRLEPKKRPGMTTSIDDSEKLESMSQVAQTVNTHFFGEGPEHAYDVETGWDKDVQKTDSRGRKWLAIGISFVSLVLLLFMVWGLVLSKGGERPELVKLDSAEKAQLSYAEKAAARREVIQKYLAATTLEEKAKYVREVERVKPHMEAYYATNPLTSETPSELNYEEPVMGKEGVVWRVDARVPQKGKSKYLIVETDEKGHALIDWETDVIYQPSDWERFISVRSSRPHTFRVFVQGAQLTGFHGYEFADYTKYRCFRITIPGRDDYLWAYSEIGSQLDRQLVSLITSGGRRNINTDRRLQAMLTLRYPENSQSAICVHIGELLQVGWFY